MKTLFKIGGVLKFKNLAGEEKIGRVIKIDLAFNCNDTRYELVDLFCANTRYTTIDEKVIAFSNN